MKRMLFVFAALLAVFAIVGISPALAAARQQVKEKDLVVMQIGPAMDLGGGVLYYPLGSRPVVFDKKDVGKPFNEIKNPNTRAQLEKITAELYGSVGNAENAQIIANASLDGLLPPGVAGETRKRITEGFAADFKKMAANGFSLSMRTPMYDESPCKFGDVCPGKCGTWMPGGPYCLTNLACVSCGDIPV